MNFLAVLLGVLPGLIWLIFYLQEDPHPEPRRLIITTFLIGGLIAVPVVVLQLLMEDTLGFLKIKNIIISIFALALIEEIFKFAAAYWTTKENPEFNEPVDAMIYLITAALGFATVENILIVGNIFSLNSPTALTQALSTTTLRFIGATLLHAAASGLAGYYWAIGLIKKSLFKKLSFGLFLAVLVHSIFNYLIWKFQSVNLLYPSLFLVLVAVFVLVDFEKLRKMV